LVGLNINPPKPPLTTQPFSTSIVAAVSLTVAVVMIAGLLIYFKKRKR
jgi:hypothetical protein